MSTLLEPTCRWRSKEEISPNRYGCSSQKLSVGEDGITLETCSHCYLRDHEPDENDPPSPQPLTFTQRAVNFLFALKVETQWRAQGGSGPTDEEKADRRRKCDTCTHRDPENDSCLLCGCYLEADFLPPRPLGKLDCVTQACPAGLWGFGGGYEPPKGGGCCNKAAT